MNKMQRLRTAAVVVGIIAINLWSLMRFPAPFVDEAWNASRAWAFIETGRQFGALDAGVFDRFEGHWTLFPWLSTFVQSLSLRLVAQPELLPLRIVSLLFGFLLLGAVYAIAKRLYDWRHGLLSVFLVSISWPFLYSAHLARTDIMAAALGFVAIGLYLSNTSRRLWVSLLSGLCVGLAFEIHAHSIIYAPTIVALYYFHLGWSMFRRRHFWAFVAGVCLGLAFYAGLHILPYPQTYLAANRLAFTSTHLPPILTFDFGVIIKAMRDTGRQLFLQYHVLIPIILWAVATLAIRGSDSDRTLLVLSGALVGGATLLIRNKLAYYAILTTPAIGLVVGAFLLHPCPKRWGGRLWDYAKPALMWGLSFVAILLNLSQLRANTWQAYQQAQDFVSQTVRPGESIMAAQTYWFGLYDHVYYSWEELIYYQRYAPGSTLEDALREFRPDIFIIDRHLDVFISDERTTWLYLEHLGLPRTEMEAFLSRNGNLVGGLENEHYGPIRVYRLNWAEETPGD